jgi:hypothetical protein
MAPQGNFEDCTVAVGPALLRGPVQIAVSTLDQRSVRISAVRAETDCAKAVKRGQRARRSYFENLAVCVRSAIYVVP